MECRKVREKLNAWVDGELPAAEAEMLAAHTQTCRDCRCEAQNLQHLARALNSLPVMAAQPGLTEKNLQMFRSRVEKPGVAQWLSGLGWAMRGVVCGTVLSGLVCGVALGSSLIQPDTGQASNPYVILYTSQGVIP